ncbi:MAG: hypothetical protein ACE5R6_14570 [Candidatus Heimdallarchaeota archaeon]
MPLTNFIDEAWRVVDYSKDQGLTLRVLGALAFRIHCSQWTPLHVALGREITDIDFIANGEHRKDVIELLKGLGYVMNRDQLRLMRLYRRYMLDDPDNDRHIDVFFDKLDYCHTIELKQRLEIDYPTISLGDLMLEKLQIVELNEKDVIDVIVLLREHEVGDDDEETVNSEYISEILAIDWGFYYTATTNLKKIREYLLNHKTMKNIDKKIVETKINRLCEHIEETPKSKKWRMRATVGTKRKWYKDVYGGDISTKRV